LVINKLQKGKQVKKYKNIKEFIQEVKSKTDIKEDNIKEDTNGGMGDLGISPTNPMGLVQPDNVSINLSITDYLKNVAQGVKSKEDNRNNDITDEKSPIHNLDGRWNYFDLVKQHFQF